MFKGSSSTSAIAPGHAKYPPAAANTAIAKQFDAYYVESAADEQCNERCLPPQSLAALCKDLEIDEDDIVVLVLAYKLGCATMPWHITHTEWVSGFYRLKIDSIPKLKQLLNPLRQEVMKSQSNFKLFYYSIFDWIKEGQGRVISAEAAVAMWRVLLAWKEWPFFEEWCAFVSEVNKKALSKDAWKQFYEFMSTVDPLRKEGEEGAYDPSGAWPSVMDEFVAWLRKQRGLE